jgi:hypothetical protein
MAPDLITVRGHRRPRLYRSSTDAAGGVEGEEVGVAGDDQLRRAIDGKLKKLVVLWVAADLYDACDRDSLGNSVE